MDKSYSAPKTAIVIAAGGQGSRLRRNKPKLTLGGVSLLDRTVSKAQAWGGPVAIAVAEQGQVATCELPILVDQWHDHGPISALQNAFRFADSRHCSHVLLLGCDMPFLPEDLLKRLAQSIGESGAAIPVSNSRPQFMAGLWKVSSPTLEDYLAKGHKSLWQYAQAQGAVRVEWDSDEASDPFADIDTQADLEAAEQRLANSRL